MRAILNVSQFSAYAEFNGRTFEVESIIRGVATVIINEVEVACTYKEVIIVNIDEEIQEQYDNKNWGSKNWYNELIEYCSIKKINYKAPTYNCPA